MTTRKITHVSLSGSHMYSIPFDIFGNTSTYYNSINVEIMLILH